MNSFCPYSPIKEIKDSSLSLGASRLGKFSDGTNPKIKRKKIITPANPSYFYNGDCNTISGEPTSNYKRQPLRISFSQWNCRSSRNPAKQEFIRNLPGDILMLQEIWHSNTFNDSFKILNIASRKTKRGGGTASLTRPDFNLTPIMIQDWALNNDSSLSSLRFGNNVLYLGNIYLSRGSPKQVQKILSKIRKIVPENHLSQVLLIGDFNVDLRKKGEALSLLRSCAKNLGLKLLDPEVPTRNGSTLDFVLAGRNIKVKGSPSVLMAPSDHMAITWYFEINFPTAIKQLKIPNRTLAAQISSSLISDSKITNSKQFLESLADTRLIYKKHIQKLVGQKKRDFKWIDMLQELDDPLEVLRMINASWMQTWKDTELIRWSQDSKIAYNRLKSILRYNLYKIRDGAIINSIISDDGSLITDAHEVAISLSKTLMEIQIDSQWPFLDIEPFPKLRALEISEMSDIICSLSTNKAITLDCASDSLFSYTLKHLSSNKLRDLWSTDLDTIKGFEQTWTSRLVPLNKAFPNTPTRKQLRPIVVSSPIIKLLEARFMPKLKNYLNNNLDSAQTGFVDNMGIHVNIHRALTQLTARFRRKECCFGLFVDFANAYNSIPHSKLFEKLEHKNILSCDELKFLKCLYARYRIRVGKIILRSNKGVAQGSILSPALFNIFLEDLSQELKEKCDLSVEETLFYADDILLLCSSPSQLEKVIKLIEEWTLKNGMSLNKSKSGIVIFARRQAKIVTFLGNQFLGIPVVDQYKYLGTVLTSRLELSAQLELIRDKSNFIFFKLFPYLKNATADGRRDMWQTLVVPLFNACLSLLALEPSKGKQEKVHTLWRKTFKQFLMIPPATPNALTNEMIGWNLQDDILRNTSICMEKWAARLQRVPPAQFSKNSRVNSLRAVPNEWCKVCKIRCTPCPLCAHQACSPQHLYWAHGIYIAPIEDLWNDLKRIRAITQHSNTRRKNECTPRALLIPRMRDTILSYLTIYKNVILQLRSVAHRYLYRTSYK